MTDLIAVHISRENNLHLQSLAKKNNCTVDDLINEAVCEYYADEIRQADTPQTGISYCNECKWFRDKQVCGRCRSLNLFAKADTPQTDEPCGDCQEWDCDGCEYKKTEGSGE